MPLFGTELFGNVLRSESSDGAIIPWLTLMDLKVGRYVISSWGVRMRHEREDTAWGGGGNACDQSTSLQWWETRSWNLVGTRRESLQKHSSADSTTSHFYLLGSWKNNFFCFKPSCLPDLMIRSFISWMSIVLHGSVSATASTVEAMLLAWLSILTVNI